MKRLNLPLILDTLFTAICAFLLFFTAVRFYTKNPILGLIFGICAALLFGALAFLYIGIKQNKKLLLSHSEREKKLLSLHLSLSSDEYLINLFKNMLGENAEIDGKQVIYGGVTYFLNFKMHPLTEDDIAKIIKIKPTENKAVYCNSISLEGAALADNFGIKTICLDEIYISLKQNNLLPKKYSYGDVKKTGILKKIKSRFSRKLCAPLFWSGLALIVLSYFTFFPIYYIVSGGLMLILSAVALVVN